MPSNDFRWMVHRPNLAASAATWDTRRPAGLVCARRVAEAPFDAQSGECEGAQARLSGKREGVPGLSERSSEFRYVGIPVIWRRRDAKTLRPAGNGRIVDRLDIDGVAL